MIGSPPAYPVDRFPPVQVCQRRWHVWNEEGACRVLERGEYNDWLINNPSNSYIINFANNSIALISPNDRLWKLLVEATRRWEVRVFELGLYGNYVPWNGDESSLRLFDAISIRCKE